MDDPLKTIATRLEAFAQERDWDGFHSPKNLAMALNVEAGELLEHFQWLTEGQSQELSPETQLQVEREIADIQIYLIRLADKLGVDVLRAVEEKIADNAKKYPADVVRGSAKKYTEYVNPDS